MELGVYAGVVAVLVGLVVFFKNKANKSGRDAILGETKGQDKILKEDQDKAHSEAMKNAEAVIQLGIEREKLRKEYEAKTRDEKAANWKKND